MDLGRCLQNACWRIRDTEYAFVRQMSVLLSHKKDADYLPLQIRLLKLTYFINNAAVIHVRNVCFPFIITKNFGAVQSSAIYLITLHTRSVTANHVI